MGPIVAKGLLLEPELLQTCRKDTFNSFFRSKRENGENTTKHKKPSPTQKGQSNVSTKERNTTGPARDNGRNPSCSPQSTLTRFSTCSLLAADDFLFVFRSFRFRCMSRHLLPLGQLPLILYSSHSSTCFFLHYKQEQEKV